MWDDGLVAAWKADQPFTLLVRVDDYPTHVDRTKYWLGFHENCSWKTKKKLIVDKPPQDVIIATTRGHGLPPFYMSGPLLTFLKLFPRAHKLRTAYGIDWNNADKIGLDDEASWKVFQEGLFPEMQNTGETADPVGRGFERNIPLCAFHWVLRRFMGATKYCLVSIGVS